MFDEQPDGFLHGECADEIHRLTQENKRLRGALERIERWHGEFPATGRYWDKPKNTRPMNYSAAFGSNGERDYMRQVARIALTPNAPLECTAPFGRKEE